MSPRNLQETSDHRKVDIHDIYFTTFLCRHFTDLQVYG